MLHDPIVEEIHVIRESLSRACDHDIRKQRLCRRYPEAAFGRNQANLCPHCENVRDGMLAILAIIALLAMALRAVISLI
jgi:hypothetical protein